MSVNPYDEFPYRCVPIEWTAPERLALASLLHGGPRTRLDHYRVLELGCADGGNLLPMAYFRRHAEFIGVDGAERQIASASSRAAALGLRNVEFVHADFGAANRRLAGQFDYIIAHGVCSWVPEQTLRDLLELCADRLAPDGLLYLNYNAKPGWIVRGMVRDFLSASVPRDVDLRSRALMAQAISAKAADLLDGGEHAYSALLANEFRFVQESEASYVAHEFLTADNHAFWRSEFLQLAAAHGFDYVADADFSYPSGRVQEGLEARLRTGEMIGRSLHETMDLFCYRQLHSPLLAHASSARHPPLLDVSALHVASSLTPARQGDSAACARFVHPSGYTVDAGHASMARALEMLHRLWPRSAPVSALFDDVAAVQSDLLALHRHGLVELRQVDMEAFGVDPNPLNEFESQHHMDAHVTNAHHMRVALSAAMED
ncbi:methyltransferase domain-containing protein [Pseudoduganella sp. HUAS MS19]